MSDIALFAGDRFYRSQFDTGQASYTVFKKDGTYYADPGFPGGTAYSGTDATAVIQNAINALTNGQVFLKAGTYSTIGKITMKPGVSIYGESSLSTIIQNNGTDDALFYDGTSIPNLDCKLANLQIKGTASSLNGLNLVKAQRLTIDNCNFNTHGQNGILLQGTGIVSIRDPILRSNTQNGILLQPTGSITSNANLITGGDIGGNTLSGIRIEDACVNNRVIGSTIQSNGAFGYICIKVTAAPIMNVVAASYFEANVTDHIRLDGCTRQLVIGCQGQANTGKGVSCINTVARSMIVMNYLYTLSLDSTSTYVELLFNDVTTLTNNAGFGYYQLHSPTQGILTTPVAVFVKAGAPVDADFPNPVNGLMVVDTTNNKFWVRTGTATWKGVVVA